MCLRLYCTCLLAFAAVRCCCALGWAVHPCLWVHFIFVFAVVVGACSRISTGQVAVTALQEGGCETDAEGVAVAFCAVPSGVQLSSRGS